MVVEKLQKESIEWAKRMLGKGSPELDFREGRGGFWTIELFAVGSSFHHVHLSCSSCSTATFCVGRCRGTGTRWRSSKWFIMGIVHRVLHLGVSARAVVHAEQAVLHDTMNCVDLMPSCRLARLWGSPSRACPCSASSARARVQAVQGVARILTVFATTMAARPTAVHARLRCCGGSSSTGSSSLSGVRERSQDVDEEYYYYCPVKADVDGTRGRTDAGPSRRQTGPGLEPAEQMQVDKPGHLAPEGVLPAERGSAAYSYKKSGGADGVRAVPGDRSTPVSGGVWAMTTVGYGDVVPQPLGKILVPGILVIAAITVIGSNFSSIYAKFTEERQGRRGGSGGELEGILEGDEDDDDDVLTP